VLQARVSTNLDDFENIFLLKLHQLPGDSKECALSHQWLGPTSRRLKDTNAPWLEFGLPSAVKHQ
jgi:hypothetical protein